MRFALVLLLAVGTLSAAPIPKELKKDGDEAKILGTWKPADHMTAWFRFDADGKMRTWHVPEVGPPIDWTYTLDPKGTPKRVKLTRTNNDLTSYDCLYEIDGDKLTVAFIVNKQAGIPDKIGPHAGLQIYALVRNAAGKK